MIVNFENYQDDNCCPTCGIDVCDDIIIVSKYHTFICTKCDVEFETKDT